MLIVGEKIERLDPDAVPRDEQSLLAGVPDRQREHAVNRAKKFFAPLLVEPEDDLGIRIRMETMTAMTKRHIAANPMAAVVRPAMGDQVRHLPQQLRVGTRCPIELKNPGDAAH